MKYFFDNLPEQNLIINIKNDFIQLNTYLSVVFFYANWCGPSMKALPIIQELANNNKKIQFFKINIDYNHAIPKYHKVKSIPTIVVFKGFKVIFKESGLTAVQELNNLPF